ncbi:MAG: N-acetylmuramate/N-acetylglucosamine kinase AmgK [Caulobacteraceae bacterium]
MDRETVREAQRRAFLKASGLAHAAREPLPGDASTRRYERLRLPSGATLMLMDQPASSESPACDPGWSKAQRETAGWNAMARLAAGRVDAFAATAAYLRSRGLSAPEIEALDVDQGLAVIEDFGEGIFARLIEQGQDEAELYFAAMDAQARLHEAPPPQILSVDGLSWPLLAYDAVALKAGADLFVEWQPRLNPALDFGVEARAEWDGLWTGIARRGEAGAAVFAHRDFHAENLLWLPDRPGAARVGMIDFQDALLAHPSWDLHSLLQDARRDVSPELEAAALDRYFGQRPGIDRQAFMADYAALAALNEARILGVFARLIVRDAKPRYAQFTPRLWRLLLRNLENPALADLKRWFDRHVPVEARQ